MDNSIKIYDLENLQEIYKLYYIFKIPIKELEICAFNAENHNQQDQIHERK